MVLSSSTTYLSGRAGILIPAWPDMVLVLPPSTFSACRPTDLIRTSLPRSFSPSQGMCRRTGSGLPGVTVALGSYQADDQRSWRLLDQRRAFRYKQQPDAFENQLYVFSTKHAVTNLLADAPRQNFSANAAFSISGKVTTGSPAAGLAGVTVTLGSYPRRHCRQPHTIILFSQISPGSKGSLIPSKVGYNFSPTLRKRHQL